MNATCVASQARASLYVFRLGAAGKCMQSRCWKCTRSKGIRWTSVSLTLLQKNLEPLLHIVVPADTEKECQFILTQKFARRFQILCRCAENSQLEGQSEGATGGRMPVRSLKNPVTLVGKVKEARGHAAALFNYDTVRSSQLQKGGSKKSNWKEAVGVGTVPEAQ
jgi:hypothetical protein